MAENIKLIFECFFGKKSHINLAGKIILSPLILIVGGTWIVMDFLFGKSPNKPFKPTGKPPAA